MAATERATWQLSWDEWYAKYKALKAKPDRTKEEQETLDYMQEKLDDWSSDGENSY